MQKLPEMLDFIGNATTDVCLMFVLTFRRIQVSDVSTVPERPIPHKRAPESRPRTKLEGKCVQNQHLWGGNPKAGIRKVHPGCKEQPCEALCSNVCPTCLFMQNAATNGPAHIRHSAEPRTAHDDTR